MSSDKQEDSPDQQRAEVAKLANRHGCQIVREFIDEGISGVETDRRKSFQEMLRYVQQSDAPKVILSWDQDRFSRLDSIDCGEVVAPLRRAGVRLITVAQGEIDWNTFAGRMMFGITQEGKNQYLHDLSRNGARARLKMALSRELSQAAIPYGYDKLIFDETGTQQRRVRFGESFAKPRSWRTRLELAADGDSVEIMRWLFDAFVTRDVSMLWLANDLNGRGVPSPTGRQWTRPVIRRMLANPVYAGDTAINRSSAAKFFGIVNGDVRPASEVRRLTNGRAKRPPTPKDLWLIVPDTHAPLIDRSTWQKAQAKLERIGQDRRNQHRPRTNDFVLTGLLYCGHCGGRMRGNASSVKRASGKVDGVRRYLCQTPTQKGKSICRCRSIAEQGLLEFVLATVQAQVQATLVDRIKAETKALGTENARQPGVQSKQLRKAVDDLDRKIERATENLLLMERAHLIEGQRKLAEWKSQRADLANRLAAAAGDPLGISPARLAQEVAAEMNRISEGLAEDDPAIVREALGTVVERIDLWFDDLSCPTKHISRFSRGLLTLRPAYHWCAMERTPTAPSSSSPTFWIPTPASRCW